MRRPADGAGFASRPDPMTALAACAGQYPETVAGLRTVYEILEHGPLFCARTQPRRAGGVRAMTIERWSAFLGVLLVVLCTPGPDFAVVLRHALADARRGVRAAAGIVTGLAVHTTAAALGLSALLAARPDVLVAIRWLGAAYLV